MFNKKRSVINFRDILNAYISYNSCTFVCGKNVKKYKLVGVFKDTILTGFGVN